MYYVVHHGYNRFQYNLITTLRKFKISLILKIKKDIMLVKQMKLLPIGITIEMIFYYLKKTHFH